MKLRAITEKDYEVLLELDKKVYPTDEPVTPKILDTWFARYPEFGMVYEEEGKIVGLCVVIPLSPKGWERLVSGEASEADTDPAYFYDENRDSGIGLHVYHIERMHEQKGFFERAFRDLGKIVRDYNIVGFSGFCVTPAGIGLFKKVGCKEARYKTKEHIFLKNGKLFLLEGSNHPSYHLVNRCEMLIATPGDGAKIWSSLI